VTIDYTKLREKLIPTPDGEPPIILRTATVAAVNSDGTVDLTMSSGVLVPDVPRLTGAYAPVGAVVQVLSLRGSLLVIGATAAIDTQTPIVKTGGFTTGPTAATFIQVLDIPFGVTFPGIPNVHINLNTATGNAGSWVGRAFGITTSNFDFIAYGPTATTFSAPWQWTALYSP
jgi:hypothetical protein